MKVLDVLPRSAQTHACTLWHTVLGDSPTLENPSMDPWINLDVNIGPLVWLLWNDGQNLYALRERCSENTVEWVILNLTRLRPLLIFTDHHFLYYQGGPEPSAVQCSDGTGRLLRGDICGVQECFAPEMYLSPTSSAMNTANNTASLWSKGSEWLGIWNSFPPSGRSLGLKTDL